MMYNLTLYTKYGTIYLLVDDVLTYDIQELMHRPWVEGVAYRWHDGRDNENGKFKRLIIPNERRKHRK